MLNYNITLSIAHFGHSRCIILQKCTHAATCEVSGRQYQLLEHKIFVYIDFEGVFCVFPSAFNFEITS